MIRNKRKVSSSASNCRSAAVILRAVGPTAQRIKDFLPRRAVGFRLFACLRPRAARILNSSARLTFLLLQPLWPYDRIIHFRQLEYRQQRDPYDDRNTCHHVRRPIKKPIEPGSRTRTKLPALSTPCPSLQITRLRVRVVAHVGVGCRANVPIYRVA